MGMYNFTGNSWIQYFLVLDREQKHCIGNFFSVTEKWNQPNRGGKFYGLVIELLNTFIKWPVN